MFSFKIETTTTSTTTTTTTTTSTTSTTRTCKKIEGQGCFGNYEIEEDFDGRTAEDCQNLCLGEEWSQWCIGFIHESKFKGGICQLLRVVVND